MECNGCCKCSSGCGEVALKFFAAMHQFELEFDHFSFSGGLAACANLRLLEEGQQLHDIIIKKGFELDLHVTNAAVDMYCAEMDEVLGILPTPNNWPRLSWNILISGFSRHGFYNKARETFHHLLRVGPQPDHVTFVALLSACNHGVSWKRVSHFSSMVEEFGVSPAIEHCVCIIDLLGRSGWLIEAEKFVQKCQFQQMTLSGVACFLHLELNSNLELCRKASNHLLELDPFDDSAYVLLSDVCAINRRWVDVKDIRRKMTSNKVEMKPGCSWVKVNNKVIIFEMGYQSHPQAVQIYGKLTDLRKMIKEVVYVPDTSFALHDTDEEQKQHNLWNHSEKLLHLACYVFQRVQPSESLRIFVSVVIAILFISSSVEQSSG